MRGRSSTNRQRPDSTCAGPGARAHGAGDAFASGISPRQAIDALAVIYTLTTMVLLGVALLFVKPTQFVVRVNAAK